MGTYTERFNLYKPSVGEQGWGDLVNQNWDIIDNMMKLSNLDIDTNLDMGTYDVITNALHTPTFDYTGGDLVINGNITANNVTAIEALNGKTSTAVSFYGTLYGNTVRDVSTYIATSSSYAMFPQGRISNIVNASNSYEFSGYKTTYQSYAAINCSARLTHGTYLSNNQYVSGSNVYNANGTIQNPSSKVTLFTYSRYVPSGSYGNSTIPAATMTITINGNTTETVQLAEVSKYYESVTQSYTYSVTMQKLCTINTISVNVPRVSCSIYFGASNSATGNQKLTFTSPINSYVYGVY